ncbi:HEPN domain-containing protein [Cellulomonas oligotrophica]|uniref:HEPN domain-containing protein n=1 Tax=Cellulomonas oligotrophica TaxID=931536 RepID=A0A7Y9JXJ9_9CELL|nr:HEPN domain-containing protein [Cellulomonas oligotrophica]NYD86808.1 hypothetical protein [Cellulomonas oligotrophica]GIG32407.1 hypothetical protein Col01nite_15660 [Cellulomonas oligotrophica]
MIARWTAGRGQVDALLVARRIERVAPSRELADLMVAQARTHLATAELVAASDPAAAFQTTYDAARKALAGVLANQGLRATGAPGAHAVLLEVALAQLDPPLGRTLRHFDWMRRTRNGTEYPSLDTPSVTEEDVRDAIPLATAIVDLAERVIPTMPVY